MLLKRNTLLKTGGSGAGNRRSVAPRAKPSDNGASAPEKISDFQRVRAAAGGRESWAWLLRARYPVHTCKARACSLAACTVLIPPDHDLGLTGTISGESRQGERQRQEGSASALALTGVSVSRALRRRIVSLLTDRYGTNYYHTGVPPQAAG